jgi:hypothetical protein
MREMGVYVLVLLRCYVCVMCYVCPFYILNIDIDNIYI